jgi:hypothetical protein
MHDEPQRPTGTPVPYILGASFHGAPAEHDGKLWQSPVSVYAIHHG